AVERRPFAILFDHREFAQLNPFKGVKRAPHAGQARRRRIEALSSVGRESFTCVSLLPQNGQRMASPVF
mgnify:CR=1